MAKLENPWRCDKCNRLKEPSNGWLIGNLITGGFCVDSWSDEKASDEKAVHLCGVECGQKWTTEQMGKLVSK